MLTCVCRPVSSSFIDNQSMMGAPIEHDQTVVTQEPKTNIGTAKPIINQNFKVLFDLLYSLLHLNSCKVSF